MREQDIFWKKFNEKFEAFKEKKIVLYGIGEKTETIIQHADNYNIIGLMDQNCTGMKIYGKKVLSIDEVREKAEIIIIVANLQSCPIIYERIRELAQQDDCSIYYINGTQPDLERGKVDSKENYFSYDSVCTQIKQSDIVSFDLFDTLIMRRTMLATDVFDIVEKRLKKALPDIIQFKQKRITAEKKCYEDGKKCFSIDDVYSKMQVENGLESNQVDLIKQIEFEVEMNVSVARKEVVDIYNYAKAANKKIILVSDMYLKRAQIISLLKLHGIIQYDDIYISSELGRSKEDGTLWSLILEKYEGEKILHIGDNAISDFEQAENYGIDSVLIKSSLEMFRKSKYSKLERYVYKSIEERIMLGEWIKDLFNSPFKNNEIFYSLDNDFETCIGKLCLGPVILTYIIWLTQQSIRENDTVILFFARDGYLLKKSYDLLNHNNSLKIPRGIYFYTSRRAASIASIQSEEDISFILNEFCKIKKAKIGTLVKRVFGIDIKENLADKYYYEIENDKLNQLILRKYAGLILANASEERKNYMKYIESLGLSDSDKYACTNFVGRGITQVCMQKVLGKKMDGFYFGTEHAVNKFYSKEDYPIGLYGNLEEPCMSSSKLISNYLIGEMFFTAPDEQLIKFDKLGQPIFNQGDNKHYTIIEKIHEESLAYINEMKKNYDDIGEWEINERFGDELYGIMIEWLNQLPKEIRQKFLFNDYYNSENENQNILK